LYFQSIPQFQEEEEEEEEETVRLIPKL